MFLFFSRSGYMKDKMNSLARSNASLYAKQHGNGGQEELYDRLRRHAYQGKKSGKKGNVSFCDRQMARRFAVQTNDQSFCNFLFFLQTKVATRPRVIATANEFG